MYTRMASYDTQRDRDLRRRVCRTAHRICIYLCYRCRSVLRNRYNLDNGQLIGNASLEITAAAGGGGGGGTVQIGGTAIPVWALVAGGAVLLLALGRKKKAV